MKATDEHTDRLRVAVVFPGDPTDPRVWSGTPAGLVGGLQGAGVEVVPVDVTPPRRLAALWTRAVAGQLRPSPDHLLTITRQGTPYARLVSATAALRVPRDADAVLQIGTGYRAFGRVRATFEDMTVVQGRRHAWGEIGALPERLVEGRRRLQQSVYRNADVCFLATSWAASSVAEDYGVPRERISVTGLGVNRPVPPAQDRDWSRPCLLFVGNAWERKNGPAVLEAFARLHARVPGAQLHLVGQGVPASASEFPGVTVHGALPMGDPEAQRRLAALFASATCLVVPSQLEPAGIVYAEAGAAGIPAIGSTVGGAADMIGPGGRVVDPKNVDALAAAMVELADPTTARTLGEQARQHAAGLTWEAVGGRIAARLREAVSGTEGAAG